MLDADQSGVVEFREFTKAFGPAISGESVGAGLYFGTSRDAVQVAQNALRVKQRYEAGNYSAEAASDLLKDKMSSMSASVRKLYQTANIDFQQAHEAEGGLSTAEFKTLLDKFNIPISDVRDACGCRGV
jgi:1,6-anhydro-N-acetylmuramate kinase